MDGKSLFWGAVAGCCVMAYWMSNNKSETKEIKIYPVQEKHFDSIHFQKSEDYSFPKTVQYVQPTRTEVRYINTTPTYVPQTTYIPTTQYIPTQRVIYQTPIVRYRHFPEPYFRHPPFRYAPPPPHFRHHGPHFEHHLPHHFHHCPPCR